MQEASLELLEALVRTASPSGFEQPVAKLYREHCEALCGHRDHRRDGKRHGHHQSGRQVPLHVFGAYGRDRVHRPLHRPDGFLFFSTIGGTDVATEIGQRVWVHGQQRVPGVIGRKAIQTFQASDSSQTPTLKELWIDIGAASREEAEKVVSIGSAVTLQAEFTHLMGNRVVGRAFDNKVGLFIAAEVVRCLKEQGEMRPDVGVYVLGTVQEEIGSRGAKTAAFSIAPATGLADRYWGRHGLSLGEARRPGSARSGQGPRPIPGCQHQPGGLQTAEVSCRRGRGALPAGGDRRYQSDRCARAYRKAGAGVATGVISIPLRYMHTPSEVLSLDDVQACIDLVCGYCHRLNPEIDFTPR